MRYQQFDEYAFDTVAGYIAPKLLGCLGLLIVGLLILAVLFWLQRAIGLPRWIIILSICLLLPAGAYASTRFDQMHNDWQIRRKRNRS